MEAAKSLIAHRLRQTRGLRSQIIFSERLGVAQQTWSKYEGGEIHDTWLTLTRLRDEEGVDLNALLTGRQDAA